MMISARSGWSPGTLRRLSSDDSTIPVAAAEFADYILDGLDRSVTAREDGTVAPERVVEQDVHRPRAEDQQPDRHRARERDDGQHGQPDRPVPPLIR